MESYRTERGTIALRRKHFRSPLSSRPARSVASLVLCGLAHVVSACSSSADAGADSDQGADSGTGSWDAAVGDESILAGTFAVKLVPPDDDNATAGTTSFLGKVYDGASLSEVVWEKSDASGGCTLLIPRVPYCSTPCGGTSACVEDETCQAYPVAHSAGTVTATGLRTTTGATTFSMSPVVNSYQPPATVSLAYPAFSEGDAITIESSGDYYAPLRLTAKGIAPLKLTSSTLALSTTTPLVLSWEAPGAGASSTIEVKLDISHHGGTKGKIECTTADTGSLEIPVALVSKLLALGVAGYPTVVVTRQSTGSATIAPGRVDLVVSSQVEAAVTVDGLVSCKDTTECPSGQTCQDDLTCK